MTSTYCIFATLALATIFGSCSPSAQEKAVTNQQTNVESEAAASQKAGELKNRIDSTVKAIKAIKGPRTLHSEYDSDGNELIIAADGSTYTPVGELTNIPLKETK